MEMPLPPAGVFGGKRRQIFGWGWVRSMSWQEATPEGDLPGRRGVKEEITLWLEEMRGGKGQGGLTKG